MKMTVKGQVTIPRPIRSKLGLHPGDDVTFVDRGDEVVVCKQRRETPEERVARVDAWIERVRGSVKTGLTTEEILDITRGPERREGR